MNQENKYDVIVIGAGPAGISTSLYLKRAGINVLLVDKNAPGGQMNRIKDIQNYPGFVKIDGPTLSYNMFMQIRELNIPYKYLDVLEIVDGEYKTVKSLNEEFTCKFVVIATGKTHKKLDLENEAKFLGNGISYCTLCDGFLYKDKNIAIVGNDEEVLKEALYLSNISNKVTLILEKEIENKLSNINIIYNKKITKLNGIDKLESIELGNDVLNIDCLFISIGSVTNLDMISKLNVKTSNGYIVVDNNMKTNCNGIYACGDVIFKDVYQISTAVGEGSIVSNSIIKELK